MRVRRYEELAQHNAPFIVVILTRAVLLVFDGVRELFTNVTVRARLAALVPLLSPCPSVHIYAPARSAHTLCPIRHSLFFTVRAYHLSKSASSHLRLPIGAKSRKIAAKCPSDVDSCRESWPRRRNFWEVESWTVESARARMLTPSSRDFLYGEVQIDRPVVHVIGREGTRTMSCQGQSNNSRS
jgi:hypothetical protein